ncbi:MAG: virulence-associated E family protein [Methylovirgula sp.]|nr:virulence-associated E family protein [Methylovirgula sp.]
MVEGPAKVDPAQRLFSDYVAIAWQGGAKNIAHVDWSVLKGRNVTLWPDRDADGQRAAKHVARLARRAGAARMKVVKVPAEWDKDWNDLKDDLPRGVTADDLRRVLEQAEQVADYQRNKNGEIVPNRANIALALENLGVALKHDEFAHEDIVEGLDGGYGPFVDDHVLVRLYFLVRDAFPCNWDLFCRAIDDIAYEKRFHPVCAYLDGLEWDGISRVETWLIDYGKAVDTKLNRAIGKLWMIAAVRRVRKPGTKFDQMLIFESPQGLNKSKAMAALAPDEGWFSDTLRLDANGRDTIEDTCGVWIIEAGELRGMSAADHRALKQFLSRQVDRGRPAYARKKLVAPRQFVIAGTTNETRYLRDTTGNRRYWPVAVDKFDCDALARDRDQLWAEAAVLEAQGVSIELDETLWSKAAEEQDRRLQRGAWLDALEDKLGAKEDKDQLDGKITISDLWALLGKPPRYRNVPDSIRLHEAMAALGFEGDRAKFNGKRARCYVRGNVEVWLRVALLRRDAKGKDGPVLVLPYKPDNPTALDGAYTWADEGADEGAGTDLGF